MNRHIKSGKRSILKTVALLLMAASIVAGAVAFSWFDSIEKNIHRDRSRIDSVKDVLDSSSKNPGQPVNILLIGSDKRFTDKKDSGRSDTLMIMRLDFDKKRAYLLSIPRDTRVKIPGVGTDKINAAYAYGGPKLSVKTVEKFTGMDLNHYIEIDFRGFKKMVDTLGGIEVDVKETIRNRQKGFTMYIPKGKQVMDGDLALNYVRYRHGDNDFKRAERQQNFLRSLADNAFRVSSLWKIPKLIQIMSKNVETDLSIRQMTKLAGFARKLKERDIETITVPGKSGMKDGVSYVFPDEDGLEALIEAIEKGRSLGKLKSDLESGKISASIEVINVTILNGTTKSGLAGSASKSISGSGIKVVSVGNASNSDYAITEIRVGPDDSDLALKVRKELMKSAKIVKSSKAQKSDVTIILGRDYIDQAEDS